VNQPEIINELRSYVTENFLYARPDYVVAEHDHLLEKGVVDSMGMLELLTFLQDRFRVEPADDEITEDNFATLGRIASFIGAKRQVN
jgi:acyl carrier protein